jgi:hypothetical protein
MDTRAGKRKAEQASDLPADGGAADSGSKIFDLAAYRVAVENANAYAADALKNMKDFHCAMEEAVRYTLGMDAQDILGNRTMTQSWSNAMSMATRAAEATAYLASPASPQLTAPFEVFEQSLCKASELKQQFDVERELRAEELDRHRKNWEERNAINSERSVVVNELKEVRSELALSKKRVDDLEGRNVACMDAEALLELRKVLENALRLVKITEDRRACLPYVPEILPLAVCPVTKQCMTNPVVAADGHTYERSAIEKHMEAAGENATSPLTGEKLASHDLVINWTMRKDIDDAVDKVLAQLARGE